MTLPIWSFDHGNRNHPKNTRRFLSGHSQEARKDPQDRIFKLKKHAREWANEFEDDSGPVALNGDDYASLTYDQLADEYSKWWSARHNPKGLNARLGQWRNLSGTARAIEIDPADTRSAVEKFNRIIRKQ
jgi:hypothetical protein